MSDQFLGEVRMFAFNYAPTGWCKADGSLLKIEQNEALFSLYSTQYGGDGEEYFGIPNLQGIVAVGFSSDYAMGQTGGEATHMLLPSEIPEHSHSLNCVQANGTQPVPFNAVFAGTASPLYHASDQSLGALNAGSISNAGDQPHENMMPFTTIFFVVAIQGTFPS